MAKLTEDKIYEIAAGLVEPSSITDDERKEFINLFAKPNSSTVDILARLHTRLSMDIDNIDEEIKTLQEYKAQLKQSQGNAEEGMLRYCSDEINTRVTRGYTFAVKESKSAEIIDEDAIPEMYRKEEKVIKVDKRLVLNDLKLDTAIPGAQLKVSKKVSFKENGVH